MGIDFTFVSPDISEEDKKEISTNVRALLIYKVGNVITSGTDNIVISKYIGICVCAIFLSFWIFKLSYI